MMKKRKKGKERMRRRRRIPKPHLVKRMQPCFPSGNVIGLIEIEALDLKYPIVEGQTSKQLA